MWFIDRNVCRLRLIKTKDVFHFTNIAPIIDCSTSRHHLELPDDVRQQEGGGGVQDAEHCLPLPQRMVPPWFGVNVIKLFTAVIYDGPNKLECLSLADLSSKV